MSKVLICGDFHVPYHDPKAVEALAQFAREYAPDILAVHGDLVDFEAFSRFLKDPRATSDPQEELERAGEILERLRKLTNHKRLIFGIGNHEQRLESTILKHAPQLIHLKSLNLVELLGLHDWEVIPHEGFLRVESLVIQHGVSYGPTTNQKNIARFGGFNVVQGHSHRLSQKFVRSLHGIHSAVEAGCLCKLNPKYTPHPDWAQGFATFENHHLRIHLIEKGKVIT